MYADLVDGADHLACITLAFGVGKQSRRSSRTTRREPAHLHALEKKDAPNKNTSTVHRHQREEQRYKAWGSYLKEPMHHGAGDEHAALKLNEHVAFIHSKSCCAIPWAPIPCRTGSANFSEPSTNENDENMVLIAGTSAWPTSTSPSQPLFNHTTSAR